MKNIEEFLKNKNNDKIDIKKNDAFFLLTGKLKIFENIDINKNIIEEIEFVDLPGVDKEENDFNQRKYNNNVLRFSNCCVYVNIANSVRDETSVLKIKEQYESDKDKIFLPLRPKFIKTVLFLKILNKDDLIICYFSSYSFMEYLKAKEKYVDLLENNPLELITNLNNDYIIQTPSESFYEFIQNKILNIETRFGLASECNSLKKEKISKEFKLKIRKILKKFNIISDDQKLLIKELYILKEAFKKKDFSNTNYSNEHYKKIE